jgi:hypothetical protein
MPTSANIISIHWTALAGVALHCNRADEGGVAACIKRHGTVA